jgi:Cu+-exporting ATPase
MLEMYIDRARPAPSGAISVEHGMDGEAEERMRMSISIPVVVVACVSVLGCGGGGSGSGAKASPSPEAGAAVERREPSAVATERDPVCGMFVDPKTAPKSEFEGETFYFCSLEDKAKFDKDPGSYASQAP